MIALPCDRNKNVIRQATPHFWLNTTNEECIPCRRVCLPLMWIRVPCRTHGSSSRRFRPFWRLRPWWAQYRRRIRVPFRKCTVWSLRQSFLVPETTCLLMWLTLRQQGRKSEKKTVQKPGEKVRMCNEPQIKAWEKPHLADTGGIITSYNKALICTRGALLYRYVRPQRV